MADCIYDSLHVLRNDLWEREGRAGVVHSPEEMAHAAACLWDKGIRVRKKGEDVFCELGVAGPIEVMGDLYGLLTKAVVVVLHMVFNKVQYIPLLHFPFLQTLSAP